MRIVIAISVLIAFAPLTAVAQAKPVRTLVVTVDDLPASEAINDDAPGRIHEIQDRNRLILQTFRNHHVPALGLVNEYKLQVFDERDARAAILQNWLDAEMELGNHTYSHRLFSNLTLGAFEDETVRGDVVTSSLLRAMGKSERYFRHPGLNLGRSAKEESIFEDFLKAHGYQIAPVSVNFDDYKFNDVLGDALSKNDSLAVDKVRAAYINYALAVFDRVERNSKALFGRQIPQILLIHDSRITQDMAGTLLTDLEQRGYRFVSIEEALEDPAYGTRDKFIGNLDRCYLCWGNRLTAIGKKPEPPVAVPAWIENTSQQLRK